MDLERIKRIITLSATSQLAEIEVAESGVTVRITRRANAPKAVPPPADSAQASIPHPPARDPAIVSTPLFGVVHLAPTPGAASFVGIGDRVSVGQQLCLIEAMKVFNSVISPAAGRIAEIYVANGAEVARGEPLFRLDPGA